MSPTRRAVIDVGTNSIKLLVADVAGHHIQPVWEDSKQTRLGKGFYETHELQPAAITNTATAVKKFSRLARDLKAETIRIIATSAARDAKNPRQLIFAINQASGLKVEIISGEQEADWAFKGVTTDPELALHPLLILDVGGGSTEFILGQGEHIDFRHSFPLGTVRLLEKLPHSDSPTAAELAGCRHWLKNFLEAEVRPRIDPALHVLKESARVSRAVAAVPEACAPILVGTGGTTSILARMEAKLETYDRERIEATRLSLEQVTTHLERLWSLPLAVRKQIVGLPKKRADVILPGAAIYEAVMEQFGFAGLRVSTRGLRFAALMDGV